MDDNESKSPWDQLASDLGAEPSSESFERSQPAPTEIPNTEDPSAYDEAADSQQSSSDWNALADTLGLEVSESATPVEKPAKETITDSNDEAAEELAIQAQEETASSPEPPRVESGFGAGLGGSAFTEETVHEEAADTTDETLPPLPSEVDQIMSEGDWEDEQDSADEDTADEDSDDETEEDSASGMSGDDARNAFDALFTADGSAVAFPSSKPSVKRPALNDNESSESESESAEEKTDSEGDEEDPPKRKRSRRRRRGRGRGGRKPEDEQSTSEESSDDLNSSDEDAADDDHQEDGEADDSTEEKKPRRRRSRRRRRTPVSEDPIKRTDVEDAVPADNDDDDDDDDDDFSERPDSSERDRTGHRNMPTWSEALNDIIEGNIELHSKAPSRQSSSRGRGRSRGGRGRKKPS